jgi:hypothetical protein
MVIATRIRLVGANFRLSGIPEDEAAGRGWTTIRRDLTIDLLRDLAPSVILGQECDPTIRADLLTGLGDNWRYRRNGNVIAFYDLDHHSYLDHHLYNLPSPPDTAPRRLITLQLQMRATSDWFWVSSAHFTVGDVDWQRAQMESVVSRLEALNIRNSIFQADLNNDGMATDDPRGIARQGGLWDLRSKLAPGRMHSDELSTWNGWAETEANGLWIDEVFTGENFMPYTARVVETNGASDHNWLLTSVIQIANET